MMTGLLHTLFLIGLYLIIGTVAVDPPYNVPTCNPSYNIVNVSEATAKNTIISTLSCSDDDTGPEGTLKYSMTSGNVRYFSVDEDTGEITNLRKFNADARTQWLVEVEVYDQGTPSMTATVIVDVHVYSINDNTPTMKNFNRDVVIDEDTPPGTEIGSCTLEDKDSKAGGLAGEVRIRKEPGGDPYHKFWVDPMNCKIYARGKFVYEKKNRFTMKLTVYDLDPIIPKSNFQYLIVRINDANNYGPECDDYVKFFHVPESTTPNSVVGSLTCTDKDTGAAGVLYYVATGGDTAILDIGNTDGQIVLKQAVDYESGAEYTLEVLIHDNGSGYKHSASAQIFVYISNEDDIPTTWAAFSAFSTNIPEDATLGSLVLRTRAADGDTVDDPAHRFFYGLETTPTYPWFAVNPDTGDIFVASPPDRELEGVTEFDIFATSSDTTLGSKIVAHITITLDDINDHAPTFTETMYQMSTPEGSGTGTTVGQVIVSDDDIGVNAQVTLTLLPSSGSGDFTLDPSTGFITTAALTDYSRQSNYHLTIEASDAGSPSQTASSYVFIEVIRTSTNNNDPVFTQSTYHVAVVESVPNNEELYTVLATDDDTGPDATLTYQIISGNGDGKFSIDPTTGAISIADPLDRESVDGYILGIRATDAGAAPRSGDSVVNITVVDVNDNSPQFSVPSVTLTVDRSSASGSTISSEYATDMDQGRNSDIMYTITSGNEEGLFIVGRTDGVVTILSDPSGDLYTLTVRGSDGGTPVLTGELTINVRVTPVIGTIASDVSFSIMENSLTALSNGEFSPSPSHRVGSTITYSITSGNFDDLFSVSSLGNGNGEIVLDQAADREIYDQYVLTVNELDDDGLSIDRIVQITILDENDNDPSFTPNVINLKVVENTPVGYPVETVQAHDPDEGPNGMVSYAIDPLNIIAIGLFQIDGNGVITIKASPDYETDTSLTFTVDATDDGGRVGHLTVNVDIVDVPEIVMGTPPAGESVHISTEVPDTAVNGDTVYSLSANDFGLNPTDLSSITYVSVNPDDAFSVTDGVIKVHNSDKLLKSSKYYVWVVGKAVETGGSTKSILGLVRIDCFATMEYMFVITFSAPRDYVQQNRAAVVIHIQSFLPANQRVFLWTVREETSGARRRLLAAQSSAQAYVVDNPDGLSLDNVQDPKTFVTQNTGLQNLQQSSDGTPVAGLSTGAFPVDQVMPYSTGEPTAEAFSASPEGAAIIALAVAAVLVLLILLIACIIWRCKKKKDKNFLNVSDPAEYKKKKRMSSPRLKDIHPVAPAGTILPVSVAASKETFSGKAPFWKKNKSISKTPQRKTYNQHLFADHDDPDVDNIKLDNDDNTSRDTGYHGETPKSTGRTKPVYKKGPQLVGGKAFDGVGFDENTKKPYLYNTKTGEINRKVSSEDVKRVAEEVNSSRLTSARGSLPASSLSGGGTRGDRRGSLPNTETNLSKEQYPPHHRNTLLHDLSGKRGSIGSVDSGLESSQRSSIDGDDVFTDKPLKGLNPMWTARTSIPSGTSTKEDICSRDPHYFGWARSIAGKRKSLFDKPDNIDDVSQPHKTAPSVAWES